MSVSLSSQAILSPCIGVCTLDERDQCMGCFRTADEIARWGEFSASERERIMASLPDRATGSGPE